MSGGGGGGDATTTTEPWEQQKPYLPYLFNQAKDLYKQGMPEAYPGEYVAGFTPAEKAGQRLAKRTARGGMTDVARSAARAQQFLTNPDLLSPESNKYLRASAAGAVRPLYEQLTETALPAIRGEAVTSGAYGSNRQGIAEGLAAGRTSRAAGDITAQMYERAYAEGLDALAKGTALTPTVQAAQLAPAQTLAGVGAQRRSYEQALIDSAIQQYNYNQALPYLNLAQYQNFIQGGYGGQTTSQSSMPGANPFLAGLGGALSGAASGAMLGSFGGPPGMAIGAGAGALAGTLPVLLG